MMPPWCEPSDFAPGAPALWEMHIDDRRLISCWEIHVAPARDHYVMLRAERGNGNDGGYIALAVSESPRYDMKWEGS